jgi:hypothetical protein
MTDKAAELMGKAKKVALKIVNKDNKTKHERAFIEATFKF